MPINDFYSVLQWWIVLFVLGFAFMPLTSVIFSSFIDKGYAFSKIIGVVAVSFIVFILGVFRLVPFTTLTIYSVFVISALLIAIITRKKFSGLITKKTIFLFIFEEIIFFLCLLSWSYVRGFNPEIYGLEKYMDFGFVNTILRSTYLPPIDMWYSPLPINYYYFGHFFTAVLTKASGISSFITYNLMIASLFALTFVETFSLGINLLSQWRKEVAKLSIRIIFGGLLVASLVTLSGNLHVIYTFFKPYNADQPQPPWQLELSIINPCFARDSYQKVNENKQIETIECSQEDQKKVYAYPNSYWYPNATRFIFNTIHEFPIYSWVVADLHGHVADVPIVLLTISVIFSALLYFHIEKNNFTVAYGYLFLIGFLLAIMYMTNAWDGLTYFLLSSLFLFYTQWMRVSSKKEARVSINPLFKIFPAKFLNKHKILSFLHSHPIVDIFSGLTVYLAIIFFTFVVISRPFSIHFDPSEIVGGIGVVSSPSFMLERKPIDQSGTNFGYDNRNLLLKILIPDHCKKIMTNEEAAKVTTQYAERRIGPFLFEPDHCVKSPLWQLFILYGFFYFFVFAFVIYVMKKKNYSTPAVFLSILSITATILIIIPEFLYMKDIYPEHYRANTMFKLVFQAFIILSIVSGVTIMRTISKEVFKPLKLRTKFIYLIYPFMSIILLTLVFTYPFFAVQSYYHKLINYISLDGLIYLKTKTPTDYEAIKWLNANIVGQPTILEAQGDSYTDYERISAHTGLPTVLGWYVHEWLWRGQDSPNPRSSEVQQIYETEELQKTKSLLKKYEVSYVVVGALEKQKYQLLNEDKFLELGNQVFKSGETSIYKISY